MPKKQNKQAQKTQNVKEQRVGYGDKKLEGPDRPAE